jgi:hypothetical protein
MLPTSTLLTPVLLAAPLLVGSGAETQDGEARDIRYIRIELPGPGRVLSLAEVQVVRNGRNLTGHATATQIATSNDAPAQRAIDGATDGVFTNGSVTHTPEVAEAWWEVDLTTAQPVDQISIWNRTDCCAERIEGYRIFALDAEREVVWSRKEMPAPGPRVDFSLFGAKIVRPEISPELRSKTQGAINQAIDRGAQYLIETQLRDGSWGDHAPGYYAGQTALSLYTLLKSGTPRTHPAVRRAVLYLRAHPPRKVYSVACALMAFGALGDTEYEERMEEWTETLVDWQHHSGLWAYPSGEPDLSNTQYAALGLLAAEQAGIQVKDKVWQRLLHATVSYQEEPHAVDSTSTGPDSGSGQLTVAGFKYRADAAHTPTGSMTTAGLSVIAIAEYALEDKITRKIKRRIEPSKRQGHGWLMHNFTVAKNPGKGDRHDYYLYGLERVGALYGIDMIGTHDWYWEGARNLLGRQAPGGQWDNATHTCFALLFLSKATASSTGPRPGLPSDLWVSEGLEEDIRWRVTGKHKQTMWITGFSPAVTSALEEVDGLVKGLRIARIEYLVDGKVFEEVPGDPDVGWRRAQRYAVQTEVSEPGPHEFCVKVYALNPAALDGADATIQLVSSSLTVVVEETFQEWMGQQALQGAKNLMPGAGVTAVASTRKSDGHAASKAADFLHGTSWIAAKDDPAPTITFELQRPVKARHIYFSHVNPHARQRNSYDRALSVEIYVNRTKRPIVVELGTRDDQKTHFELPKTLNVRRLEFRILSSEPGARFPGEVGFSEIELLGPR